MVGLPSKPTTCPYHCFYSHANGAPTYSSSWYTPSRSAVDEKDMPWYHMAHTFTCVGCNKKTKQWILQQQMEAEDDKFRAMIADQAVWDEMMHFYEMEAELLMGRGEEAQRRAAEKTEGERLFDEEVRRLEAMILEGERRIIAGKQRKMEEQRRRRIAEERRKMAEERRSFAEKQWKMQEEQRKMQEEQKERDRRAKKAVLEAWRRYEDRWKKLLASTEALEFSSIPWPVARTVGKAEDITAKAVVAFLFSPVHSETQTRKERLRSAQLRWHPDRFQRVLKRVKDKDKPEVERAVGIIARCLNDVVPY